jgi:hypothetical protein
MGRILATEGGTHKTEGSIGTPTNPVMAWTLFSYFAERRTKNRPRLDRYHAFEFNQTGNG